MFCSKCGNEVANGASFCPKCAEKAGETTHVFSSKTSAKKAQNDAAPKNVVSDKKKRKGKVTIVLEKEGCPAISVECPAKIKQNPVLVWLTIRFSGFPPLNVTPKDWKGFFLHLALFSSIFVFGALVTEIGTVGVILTIIDAVFNCIFEANYYFRFIKRKISEGYSVNDAEQRSLCEMAGVFGKK